MATIPHTPDRSRLPGIPDVRVGVPRVTAEDFGAAKLRDVIDLSRAGQESGLEQMRYAHGYAKAEADQVYAVAYGEASKEQVQLAQTKGNEATDVPERMQKAVQRIAEKHRGSIKTANGRAMFDRMMMDVGREKDVWAYQHKLKEEGDAVATGVMAKNESESDGVIAMAGQGAGVEHVIGGIQRIKANNAELYRGMPKEKIDLENRKSTMDVIEKSAARIAANPTLGPQAAMDFLDSGIEQEVAGGEVEKAMFNEIRQRYKTADSYSRARDMATYFVDQNADPAEIMKAAYNMFPDDPKMAQFTINFADTYTQKKAVGQAMREAAEKDKLWQEYYAGGANPETISPEVFARYPEVANAMVAYSSKAGKIDVRSLAPNYNELDKLVKMDQAPLRDWLANPDNVATMQLWAAGDDQPLKAIRKRAWGEQEKDGGGGASGGKGKGSWTVSEFNDAFEQNFGAMFKGFLGGDKAYNPKDAEHARLESNFRHVFTMRMRDPESYPGKSPESRETDIFYQTVADVRDGALKLDKPTYDARMEKELSVPEMPVAADRLTPEQEALNRYGPPGQIVETFDPDTGAAERFKKIDVNGGEIPLVLANAKPTRVVQAFQRGKRGGIIVNEGDILADLPTGEVMIFDSAWNYRTTYIDPDNPVWRANVERAKAQIRVEANLAAAQRKLAKNGPEWVKTFVHPLEDSHPGQVETHWDSTAKSVVIESPMGIVERDELGYPVSTTPPYLPPSSY